MNTTVTIEVFSGVLRPGSTGKDWMLAHCPEAQVSRDSPMQETSQICHSTMTISKKSNDAHVAPPQQAAPKFP